jgi:hypothetical protein
VVDLSSKDRKDEADPAEVWFEGDVDQAIFHFQAHGSRHRDGDQVPGLIVLHQESFALDEAGEILRVNVTSGRTQEAVLSGQRGEERLPMDDNEQTRAIEHGDRALRLLRTLVSRRERDRVIGEWRDLIGCEAESGGQPRRVILSLLLRALLPTLLRSRTARIRRSLSRTA